MAESVVEAKSAEKAKVKRKHETTVFCRSGLYKECKKRGIRLGRDARNILEQQLTDYVKDSLDNKLVPMAKQFHKKTLTKGIAEIALGLKATTNFSKHRERIGLKSIEKAKKLAEEAENKRLVAEKELLRKTVLAEELKSRV